MINTNNVMALADVITNMNKSTYAIADRERQRVLAKTGNKLLAEQAWQATVSKGYLLAIDVVNALSKLGE